MKSILKRLSNILAGYEDHIDDIYIFGSFIKDRCNANDIDVIITTDDKHYKELKLRHISDNVFFEPLLCSYTKTPDINIEEQDKSDKADLPIHITALPKANYSDKPLWVMNRDHLINIKSYIH